MAWSTEFQHILQAHVDEWKDTKGNVEERKTLIKKLMVDIKTHHEQSNNEGILPVDLAKKITTWFQNNKKTDNPNAAPENRRGIQSYTKKYTLKTIVQNLFRERIYEVIEQKTVAEPGSTEWLSHYPAVLSTVLNGLTEDELAECQEEKEKWNEEGPTLEQQQLNAKRNLAPTLRKVINDLERTMGVQLVIMAGYKKTDGTLSRQKFESHPFVGDEKFSQRYPKSVQKSLSTFGEYLQTQFGNDEDSDGDSELTNSDEDTPGKKANKKSKESEVKLDEDNWPILPLYDSQSLSLRKEIIRNYVTSSYRTFTNNDKAVVPWKSLSESNGEYLTVDSLPEGTLLLEPSKLQLAAVTKLWNHWRQRQGNGDRGLIFIYGQPQHIKEGKGKDKGKGKPKKGPWTDLDDAPEVDAPRAATPGPSQPGPTQHDSEDETPSPQSPAVHKQLKKHRIGFLKSLSKNSEYLDMVKTLERIKGTDIIQGTLDGFPDWVSWSYPKEYLPKEFHSAPGAVSFRDGLNTIIDKASPTYAEREYVALAIGLAIRDITAAVNAHDNDDDDDLPTWVRNSPMREKHINVLLTACEEMASDLGPAPSPSKKRKAAEASSGPAASPNKKRKAAEASSGPAPSSNKKKKAPQTSKTVSLPKKKKKSRN